MEFIIIDNRGIWYEDGLRLDTILSFGKYKGLSIKDIPYKYFNYLIKNGTYLCKEVIEFFNKKSNDDNYDDSDYEYWECMDVPNR